MPETPQLSVTPSSATTSISGSAKRRSTRIPGRSEEAVSSLDIANVMGDKDVEKSVDQSTSLAGSPGPQEGWKHPAELQYIRRADWSQDLMITYLCQKAFTVPPRQPNTTLSYTEITRSLSGEKIHVPRGYRIPLLFVAKFQWESLRLVLNSASEWEEYKFDIIHLSRLCTHFFKQAKSAASENKLNKAWRSPMFDRALIRFYRKWMVSREWSVKKFWEEFEEDEYTLDVLKFDWSRWVLKGHKGFVLTKEEVQNGITADQYREGLKRRPDGTWMWGGDDSGAKDAASLDALTCLASQDAVEAITDATPSHDSIEVKQELLEIDNEKAVLNNNGKRRRGDDGDSLRKPSARLPKKSRSQHKTSAKKKAAANAVPSLKTVSPASSGDERPIQREEDTAMDKDAVPQSSSLANNFSLKIPSSRSLKRKMGLKKNSGTSSPSTKATMATISTDLPSDRKLDLPVIPTPSTDGSKLAKIFEDVFPMVSTQLDDVSGAVLSMSTVENVDKEIFDKLPLLVPPDVQMLNPTLKTIPNPWPTKHSQITVSTQSEAGCSSDISNDRESNPTPKTTPIDQSMQTNSIDPETTPNTEVLDPDDLIIDAPPSSPITGQLSSTDLTITALVPTPPPSSSLAEANLPMPPISELTTSTTTANSNLSSTPDVHPHIPVLPPSLPHNPLLISDNSNGPVDPDPGDGDRDSNPPFLPELKVKIIQTILDTVQRITAPQFRALQATTGSGVIDAGEERNNREPITIPLSPVSSQSEQLVYPASLTSGASEVEPIVVGTQTVVEKVDAEENGIGVEILDGIDPSAIVPVDSEALQGTVEGEKGMEGMEGMEVEKDMVDEPEVMGTIGDLVDDTNGTGLSMENYAVKTQQVQQVQLRQETPTTNNMDEVEVAMEKVADEVHTQSRQETPMNNADGVAIGLEVEAVEGQSINSQSFTGTLTPMNDSTAAHSALESILSHGELEVRSREVEITHAGNLEDKMNVDEEMVQPIPPTQPFPAYGTSPINTLHMTPVVRTKSLHSIQLLQGLIHFLRIPPWDRQLGVSKTLDDDSANLKSQPTCPAIEQAHYPLLVGPGLLTQEAISVDQRLDILAHVSVTLAKNLYPYRGKDLEARIDILDKSLQQQFEMIQKLDSRSCGEMDEPLKELGMRPDTAFGLSTASISTSTISQGVQTLLPSDVNRHFESVEVQTEVEHEVPAARQPLCADATMVDLTIPTSPPQEEPSTPAATAEPPENNHSVARTVMSMMRNMADLLECTTQGTSHGSLKSPKGKEKEVVDVDMPGYLESPAFTTILEEFKRMKEEMRRSQHRSQSEVESMRLSHFMEVEALKDEVRNIESRGKQELEEVTRQYSQQIGELKTTIKLREERERARDREKESGSEKLPSLELLEIRRRVASLEARSRSDSISADMLRSASRASMNGHFQEPVISRHPSFNPPHLLPTDLEEQPYITTFRAPRQYMREGSMSKPGTPAPSDRHPFSNRHPDAMDLDESMPLPAKSQRKMHMMNFPRPPMG